MDEFLGTKDIEAVKKAGAVDPYNKTQAQLLNDLHKNVVRLVYRKKDGTRRVAYGTLNKDLILAYADPGKSTEGKKYEQRLKEMERNLDLAESGQAAGNAQQLGRGYLRYFDLGAEDFRMFKVADANGEENARLLHADIDEKGNFLAPSWVTFEPDNVLWYGIVKPDVIYARGSDEVRFNYLNRPVDDELFYKFYSKIKGLQSVPKQEKLWTELRVEKEFNEQSRTLENKQTIELQKQEYLREHPDDERTTEEYEERYNAAMLKQKRFTRRSVSNEANTNNEVKVANVNKQVNIVKALPDIPMEIAIDRAFRIAKVTRGMYKLNGIDDEKAMSPAVPVTYHNTQVKAHVIPLSKTLQVFVTIYGMILSTPKGDIELPMMTKSKTFRMYIEDINKVRTGLPAEDSKLLHQFYAFFLKNMGIRSKADKDTSSKLITTMFK